MRFTFLDGRKKDEIRTLFGCGGRLPTITHGSSTIFTRGENTALAISNL